MWQKPVKRRLAFAPVLSEAYDVWWRRLREISQTRFMGKTDSQPAERAFTEQAIRLLEGERRLLEMIALDRPLGDILTELCLLVEEAAGNCLCGIVLVDASGTKLEHGAAPSLPTEYNEAIHGRPVNLDSGPCAMAACSRQQVITTDVVKETRWDGYQWCELALAHGLQSCWSTPILSSKGDTLGTFAVYAREARDPDERWQAIIGQFTHLASIAIERTRAQQSLAGTVAAMEQLKDQFQLAIDTIPGLVWSALPDGQVDYLNQRWREYTGLAMEEASGWGWVKAIHPNDLLELERYWRSLIESRRQGETEARLRGHDGTCRWFLFRAIPLKDNAGNLVKWYGQTTDIDQRKRAEALLAGEKRLLEMIARGEALTPILEAMCNVAESLAEGALVSILLVSSDGKRLRHGAAPSLPASYATAIDGGLIGPVAGSCGTAAWRKEAVIVPEIEHDQLWKEYRELALGHELKACWSSPIFASAGEVLGTFALYSRKAGWPSPRQMELVGQFAHLASIAIERTRAQEALRRSEAYLTEAQRLSQTGSFGWNTVTGEISWSAETYCILGYERETKPTLELVFNRVHPEDLEAVRRVLDRATQEELDLDLEHRLQLPDGQVKHVYVIARATKNSAGELEFVGAVMDITERKRTEMQLRESESSLARAQKLSKTGSFSYRFETGEIVFSEETCRIFGFDPQMKVTPEMARDRVHPEDVDRFRQILFGQDKDFSFECRLGLPDGTVKHLEVIASAVRGKNGQLAEWAGAVRDITERKQAAEALRASEKFARGQAEALTGVLDALARESSADRVVEHVLQTITRQLDAHSSSVWLKEEETGRMVFAFALENGRFKTKSDTVLAAISPSLAVQDIWPWPEVFRTGKACALEDIREGPDFPWRAHVLAQGVITIVIVPMLMASRVAGVIGIRFTQKRVFSPEENELAQALANQAMLAIQLTKLSTLSRQAAVIAERNRMAREIHDTLAQGFTGVIVQLEAATDATVRELTKESAEHVRRAGNLARESLQEARRSVRALRPLALEEKQVGEALSEMFSRMTQGTPLQVGFGVEGPPRQLPPEWEENLLRCGQELLTNALRHAQADQFQGKLVFAGNEVRLQVTDNGRGFDPGRRQDGFGLVGIRERVEGMGGKLLIESTAGQGTAVFIVLPHGASGTGTEA